MRFRGFQQGRRFSEGPQVCGKSAGVPAALQGLQRRACQPLSVPKPWKVRGGRKKWFLSRGPLDGPRRGGSRSQGCFKGPRAFQGVVPDGTTGPQRGFPESASPGSRPRCIFWGPHFIRAYALHLWRSQALQALSTRRLYPPSPFCGDARSGTSVEASSAHANGQRRSRQLRV